MWQRVLVGSCVTLAALSAWLFYVRYWKWRDCIEEALSSCITPDGDNLIEAGALWAVPAVLFAAAALRSVVKQ